MTHKLIVYNATDTPLRWRLTYVDEGANSLMPKSNVVPAMERGQTVVVNGGTNAAEAVLLGTAEFHFINTNGLKGSGYLLQFDPNEAMPHGATVMIDIPFWGDNSMYVSFQPQAEAGEALYESLEGAHKVESLRDSLGRYSATLTYNALSGECNDPTEGGEGYYYSSILLFQGQAEVPYARLPPTLSGWSQAFSEHQHDGYLAQCPNWTRDNHQYRVRYRYGFVTASGQESARSPWSVLGTGIAGTTDVAGYVNAGDLFMAQLQLPVDSLGRAQRYNVYRQFEGAAEALLRWPEFHARTGSTLCLDNDG